MLSEVSNKAVLQISDRAVFPFGNEPEALSC